MTDVEQVRFAEADGHRMFDSGYDMLWGSLMVLLFWLSTIGMFVWGLRMSGTSSTQLNQPTVSNPALKIAKNRCARVELSREECLALIDDLIDLD